MANGPDEERIRVEDIDSSPTDLPLQAEQHTQEEYVKLLDSFNTVSNEKIDLQREVERLMSRTAELERTVRTNDILDSLIVPMSGKIFWFMCACCLYAGFIILVVCIKGNLSVKTLDVLVGSSAITVVGLVGTIVAGIFTGARRGRNS